ncbi:hypothetical protein F5878DRAFT_646119 [Lentinula raphanica]|uniref:DUF6532 domain-containing protein n=1 Tax=Lentinula raphanica TaxID=153919 RepID=A0AA38NZ69_9AGAR|nr:hypothetical protein F5878DRAFT_646119 [Lentinula raphanica]
MAGNSGQSRAPNPAQTNTLRTQRPVRANRGLGGAVAQLEKVGNSVTNTRQRGGKSKVTPADNQESVNRKPRSRTKNTRGGDALPPPQPVQPRSIPKPICVPEDTQPHNDQFPSHYGTNMNSNMNTITANRYANQMNYQSTDQPLNQHNNHHNADNSIQHANQVNYNYTDNFIQPTNQLNPHSIDNFGYTDRANEFNQNEDWSSFSMPWNDDNLHNGGNLPRNEDDWYEQDRSMLDMTQQGTFPAYRNDAESRYPQSLQFSRESEHNEQDEDVVDAHRSRNRTFKPPAAASLLYSNFQQTGNYNFDTDARSDSNGDADADADADAGFNGDGDAGGDTDADGDTDHEGQAGTGIEAPGANSYVPDFPSTNPRQRYLSPVPSLRATNLAQAPSARSFSSSNLLSIPSFDVSRAPSRASRGPTRASSAISAEHNPPNTAASSQKVSRSSQGTSDPTTARFYPPAMRRLIRYAKDRVHLYLVTQEPFPPARNPCFANALDHAIARCVDEQIQVEEGYLNGHREDILKLLYKDTSFYRSAIKRKIRPIVVAAYKLPLVEADLPRSGNCNSADEVRIVQEKVAGLLLNHDFLKYGVDEQGKTNNVAHPCLRDSCVQAYYNESTAIAQKFPDQFSTSVPIIALAFVMTVVRNCIEEYEDGPKLVKKELSSVKYCRAFKCMVGILNGIKAKNALHWNKVQRNLDSWAQAGCKAAGMSKNRREEDDSDLDEQEILAGFTLD